MVVGQKVVEFIVGIFILLGVLALLALAFNVSGLSSFGSSSYYTLSMEFNNVGGLKVRAPVSIGGVSIGKVASITLDKDDYRAKVVIDVQNTYQIPTDSSASILTQGLLGSNYISIIPGFQMTNLKPGGQIITTHSALILENLIGQLMYSLKSSPSSSTSSSSSSQASQPTT
jgi:phospholipid/cholesterol/gamma-HCH transport system substrate-binding protein